MALQFLSRHRYGIQLMPSSPAPSRPLCAPPPVLPLPFPPQVDCATLAAAANLPGLGASAPATAPLLLLLPSQASSWNASSSSAEDIGADAGAAGASSLTLYLQYGKPAPLSIAPCTSLTAANQSAAASCAAAAWDEADGDLSDKITVADVTGDPLQAV